MISRFSSSREVHFKSRLQIIAGYQLFCQSRLSQYAVLLDHVPPEIAKKLPKYPMVPTTLIGRLAVSGEFRGQGHGETLFMDALYRIRQHSKEVASAGAIVEAIDAAAVAFYTKYGFLELPHIPRRLFLPVGTIAGLFK